MNVNTAWQKKTGNLPAWSLVVRGEGRKYHPVPRVDGTPEGKPVAMSAVAAETPPPWHYHDP